MRLSKAASKRRTEKGPKDIVDPGAERACITRTAPKTFFSILVIDAALLGIPQCFIRSGYLFEPILEILVASIGIRMELSGKPPIGLFDFVFGSIS